MKRILFIDRDTTPTPEPTLPILPFREDLSFVPTVLNPPKKNKKSKKPPTIDQTEKSKTTINLNHLANFKIDDGDPFISSDEDVIVSTGKYNVARARTYRPLPGSDNADVTVTVYILDRPSGTGNAVGEPLAKRFSLCTTEGTLERKQRYFSAASHPSISSASTPLKL